MPLDLNISFIENLHLPGFRSEKPRLFLKWDPNEKDQALKKSGIIVKNIGETNALDVKIEPITQDEISADKIYNFQEIGLIETKKSVVLVVDEKIKPKEGTIAYKHGTNRDYLTPDNDYILKFNFRDKNGKEYNQSFQSNKHNDNKFKQLSFKYKTKRNYLLLGSLFVFSVIIVYLFFKNPSFINHLYSTIINTMFSYISWCYSGWLTLLVALVLFLILQNRRIRSFYYIKKYGDPNRIKGLYFFGTGDVYLVTKNNVFKWVKNPESLKAMGYNFNDVRKGHKSWFKGYKNGSPISIYFWK